MRCRIYHKGDPRTSPNLSVADFTLAPGYTSPDFELRDGSPEREIIDEWVREDLVKIIEPISSTATSEDVGGAGGRSGGRQIGPEEVKEYMSPNAKRRRRLALSRTERNTATHKRPVGKPFGHGKNAKVYSSEELAEGGKPDALAPPAEPEDNALEEASPKHIFSTEEVQAMGQSKPMDEPEGETLSPADLKKLNKANIEITEEEEVVEVAEEKVEEAEEPSTQGEITEDTPISEQPIDTILLDAFVEQLSDPDMRKKDIEAIAALAEIELPSQINKTPLIALVAEQLVKKGHTELPGDE